MSDDNNLKRVLIVNFVSALIITLVACYFLSTVKLYTVMHIANLFGLYFLVVYGIDILIESGEVENNYKRFLLAICLIFAFDIVFLILTPLIFGADVFALPDYLVFVFNGARLDLTLNVTFYLVIFAVLMLIFNLLLYFKDRKAYNN